jgi:hypothetical protein
MHVVQKKSPQAEYLFVTETIEIKCSMIKSHQYLELTQADNRQKATAAS